MRNVIKLSREFIKGETVKVLPTSEFLNIGRDAINRTQPFFLRTALVYIMEQQKLDVSKKYDIDIAQAYLRNSVLKN